MATVHCDHACRDGYDDEANDAADTLGVGALGRADLLAADGHAAVRHDPRRSVLHRIAEVRRQQGVTLRNAARRLGMSLPSVRRQEQADCDLRLSDLHRWQQVLEVPIADLLVEGEGQLSGPVLERARMVKLMKTAAAVQENTAGTAVGRLAKMLVDQILEIMPELSDVTPWNTVGQRRTLDDVGRVARTVVPEEIFRRPQQR